MIRSVIFRINYAYVSSRQHLRLNCYVGLIVEIHYCTLYNRDVKRKIEMWSM